MQGISFRRKICKRQSPRFCLSSETAKITAIAVPPNPPRLLMTDIPLGSMATVAQVLMRVRLEPTELQPLVVALLLLLADLDRLRSLPLKECEPPFVFQPIEA
jgi:hypothetical protein